LNFVLPADKSNPSIGLKERLGSSSQFIIDQQKSFVTLNEYENSRQPLQQVLHEGKSKEIRSRLELSENPSPTKMDFYDMPGKRD